jgi:predicted small lipoprotein YifL
MERFDPAAFRIDRRHHFHHLHHRISGYRYTARMRHGQLLTSILLCAWLIGCGQTGPLYLPERSGEQVQPEQLPTNPTPESRRDRKTQPGTDDVPATDTQTPVSPPDPDRPSP